jgi:glycerate 2-kinase
MHYRITNRDELLSHGNIKARKVALKVIEDALNAVDSYKATRKIVQLENDRILIVDSSKYDLRNFDDIFVVGAGKATFPIAQALDEILGHRIREGLIIVKAGEKRKLKHIKTIEAGHPVPDEAGLKGAGEIMHIAGRAGEKDLVLCLITGGASALLPLPADGISLRDKQAVTNLLLKSGAKINEINTIRNHLSAIKGGRLAKQIHPAEIINLMVIDEVAGLPWGPTIPDSTTFADAISILRRYDLDTKVPMPVMRYLTRADPKGETLKLEDFRRKGIKAHNIILADSGKICEAAKKSAEKLGLNSMILSSVMEGESREVGIALSGVAREVESQDRPLSAPAVVVVGGETTVTIVGKPGEGGRNQEFALATSIKINGSDRIAVASIGTDGTDGPTDIAGAIVDGYTVKRATEKGIDVHENLIRHNSSFVFRQLRDAMLTGSTGTNVMDLRLLVIMKS